MAQRHPNWTLTTLADRLGGRADGPDVRLARPVPAGSDDPAGITFAENERFLAMVESSAVGAVIVTEAMPTQKPAIRVASPRLAFGVLLAIHARPLPLKPGIDATAIVDETALVAPTACVGPYSVIEPGAEVQAGARIHAFCYVGQDCRVGENAVLLPRVTLIQDVSVGARTVIHSGSVIGADGFGYFWDGEKRSKVPQVGGVRIGSDVEIGANVCIDRATCGETSVGDGVKLDNLIQVGHNVEIDDHTVIAALTGISGSVRIGKRVVMGGQVAINDHTEVGDDVVLAGRTGIMRSVSEVGEYFGTPATPAKEALRILSLQRRLPEMLERIKELEARLAKLES